MDDQNSKNEISATLKDFETVCSYVIEKTPLLTPKGALNTKSCFELNTLMTYPISDAKQTYHMIKYPSISLYFTTAMGCGLFEPCPAKGQKTAVTVSEAYEVFQQMNDSTKYLTLFLSWMRYCDSSELGYSYAIPRFRKAVVIDEVFKGFKAIGDKPIHIIRDERCNYYSDECNGPQKLMNFCPSLAFILRDFGLISFANEDVVKIDEYSRIIKQISITGLGIAITAACYSRRFEWVNIYESTSTGLFYGSPDEVKMYKNDYQRHLPGTKGFFSPFHLCFPREEIDTSAVSQVVFPKYEANDKTVFEFRVQFESGCYRVISCHGKHTFEDLHLAIQKAYNFDNDHLYSFFMDGKKWSKHSVNSPYSDELPSADGVYIGEARLRRNQEILYLFDYGDEWCFQVTLTAIRENDSDNIVQLHPQIIKSVGKSPEQYPNYDDDWDEDWDEELEEFLEEESDEDS